MARLLTLYIFGIKEVFNRLRHDLGRELAVLIASAVLLSVFFYVFNDFLNVEVASLSAAMRERFATVSAVVALLLAVALAARSIRSEQYAERSWRQSAVSLGESPSVVRAYLAARYATLLILVHGVAWWAVQRWLLTWPPATVGFIEIAMLICTIGLVWVVPVSKSEVSPKNTTTLSPLATSSVIQTLAAWRLKQMLRRNRVTRTCLAMTCIFLGLIGWAAARSTPPFVAASAGFVAGLLAATTLALQMAEDLPHAWAERGLGVTHDSFIDAYQRLGLVLGLATGIAAALLYGCMAALNGPLTLLTLNAAAKILIITALPPILAPLLLLQIDGRRPVINVLIIFVVSLFLGTAVLAHWLGLLLYPLLRYYALEAQAGRFYRA